MPAIVFIALLTASSLQPQTTLLVTIRDDFNIPLSGIEVNVALEADPRQVAKGTSDGLGVAVLSVTPFRPYIVTAAASGYESPSGTPINPPPGEVAVSLLLRREELLPEPEVPQVRRLPNGSIIGKVLTLDGEPAVDVPVKAKHQSSSNIYSGQTRADGSFALSVPPGSYDVESPGVSSASPWFRSTPSYVAYEPSETTTRVGVSSRGISASVDLRLKAVRHFNVTVAVKDNAGARVPYADVTFSYRRDFRIPHSTRGEFRTDASGIVQLGPMPPGPVTIIARHGERPDMAGIATIDVRDAPLDDVTVALTPAGRLVGRVEFLDRQVPLHGGEGIRVLQHPPDSPLPGYAPDDAGLVNAIGEFTLTGLVGDVCLALTGLPSGWRLRDITHRGEDMTARPFTIESGDTVTDVLIRVEPGEWVIKPPPRCSR
jgi:hypothetical protein